MSQAYPLAFILAVVIPLSVTSLVIIAVTTIILHRCSNIVAEEKLILTKLGDIDSRVKMPISRSEWQSMLKELRKIYEMSNSIKLENKTQSSKTANRNDGNRVASHNRKALAEKPVVDAADIGPLLMPSAQIDSTKMRRSLERRIHEEEVRQMNLVSYPGVNALGIPRNTDLPVPRNIQSDLQDAISSLSSNEKLAEKQYMPAEKNIRNSTESPTSPARAETQMRMSPRSPARNSPLNASPVRTTNQRYDTTSSENSLTRQFVALKAPVTPSRCSVSSSQLRMQGEVNSPNVITQLSDLQSPLNVARRNSGSTAAADMQTFSTPSRTSAMLPRLLPIRSVQDSTVAGSGGSITPMVTPKESFGNSVPGSRDNVTPVSGKRSTRIGKMTPTSLYPKVSNDRLSYRSGASGTSPSGILQLAPTVSPDYPSKQIYEDCLTASPWVPPPKSANRTPVSSARHNIHSTPQSSEMRTQLGTLPSKLNEQHWSASLSRDHILGKLQRNENIYEGNQHVGRAQIERGHCASSSFAGSIVASSTIEIERAAKFKRKEEDTHPEVSEPQASAIAENAKIDIPEQHTKEEIMQNDRKSFGNEMADNPRLRNEELATCSSRDSTVDWDWIETLDRAGYKSVNAEDNPTEGVATVENKAEHPHLARLQSPLRYSKSSLSGSSRSSSLASKKVLASATVERPYRESIQSAQSAPKLAEQELKTKGKPTNSPTKNISSIRNIAALQVPASPRSPGYEPKQGIAVNAGKPDQFKVGARYNEINYSKEQLNVLAHYEPDNDTTKERPRSEKCKLKITKSTRMNRPLPSTPFLPEDGVVANFAGTKYKAILAYTAQLSDELDLLPGDLLKVYELFDDGWCLARIVNGAKPVTARQQGVCPISCLTKSNL